jgi:hypothetical protein
MIGLRRQRREHRSPSQENPLPKLPNPGVVIPTLSSEEDDEIINSVVVSGGGRGVAAPGEGCGGAVSGEISFLLPRNGVASGPGPGLPQTPPWRNHHSRPRLGRGRGRRRRPLPPPPLATA